MPRREIKLFFTLIVGTLLLIIGSICNTTTDRVHTGYPQLISNTSAAIGMLNFTLISEGLKHIPWLRTQYTGDDTRSKVLKEGNLPIVKDTFRIIKQRHVNYSNLEMTGLILGKERAKDFHSAAKLTGNSSIPDAFRPRTYSYLLNNETVCRGEEVIGYVLCIYSSPEHFHERREIRKYWGHPNLFIRYPSATLFFLGAVHNPTLQWEIDHESRTYGDIIQANFTDSYKNLSLKGITMLHWLDKFCNNSKYVMKADDDVYVDMFQAVKVLQSMQEASLERFIIGDVLERNVIIRDLFMEPKWVVEKNLFPNKLIYPTYYHGWIYIISSDIIHDMYKAAMTTPVYFIDDVYISGLLTSQIPGITYMRFEARVPYNGYIPTYPALAKAWSPDKIEALWCKHLQSLRDEDGLIIAEERLKELYRVQCPLRRIRL